MAFSGWSAGAVRISHAASGMAEICGFRACQLGVLESACWKDCGKVLELRGFLALGSSLAG